MQADLSRIKRSKLTDIYKVYISKPSDYPHQPSKLLLFLSSGTGIHSKNNQLQADKYASEGFVVVAPDQYERPSTSLLLSLDLTTFEDSLVMHCPTIPQTRTLPLRPTPR